MPDVLPIPPREEIEREAREAAAAGIPLEDACRFRLASDAGRHFAAVYLLAKPKTES